MKIFSVVVFSFFLTGCATTPPMKVGRNDWSFPKTEKDNLPRENPKTMVIIFDGSGSMSGQKIAQAKRATRLYIDSLPEEIRVGLVAFSEKGVEKLSDSTTNHRQIHEALMGIVASGGTPLGEAVGIAYTMLFKTAQELGGRGEYHLVVVTDGETTDGSLLEENINQIVNNSPVRVFTIGFQIGSNHTLNQKNPQIRYVSAENEAEIGKGLEKVLAEAEPEPAK